jgi:hypothetical protein
MKNIFAAVFALCGVVFTQTTASVDPGTQIAFQTWSNTNGFKVSVALPQAGGTDFIGQIVRLSPPLPSEEKKEDSLTVCSKPHYATASAGRASRSGPACSITC